MIVWVEGETHDAELLTADTFQRIKLVDFVQRSVKEMFLGFSCTHHEGWVGHVGINLLDDEVFGALALVLVGTLAHHFVLPFLFTFQVFLVTLTDILHDEIDRFLHAALSCSCAGKQHAG